MTKKVFFSFCLLLTVSGATAVLNSCSKDVANRKEKSAANTTDPGIVINGVKWATRNVAVPGTFVAKPDDVGRFYQWNRKIPWSATGDVIGWNGSEDTGDTWEKSNDPSPAGWRVPTLDEIGTLLDTEKVASEWVPVNGVNGRRFTDKATWNSMFLPAAGCRDYDGGRLCSLGAEGYYWSSSQYDSFNAYYFYFNSGYGNGILYWRWSWHSVSIRPTTPSPPLSSIVPAATSTAYSSCTRVSG